MLKVTKVQPIATHRDYTRKDRGNFQEIYCKARENCGILCAQAEDYGAAKETVKKLPWQPGEITGGLYCAHGAHRDRLSLKLEQKYRRPPSD